MEYPSWQSSRERLGKYCLRRPWENPLYQLVYHYRDELERRWDELFFERYGHLRPEVLVAFDRFLNCGIIRHGCARAQCTNCNHSMLVAFSCKRRALCPSCQAKRAILFAEHLHENVLLPFPHRHLTFSIPKRLRIYFRYDRTLLAELYRAAWESLSEVIGAALPEATPGAVMALHSWGNLLNWHPHVHSIVLNGAIGTSGEFLPLDELDTNNLTERFSEKVFAALLERELINKETVEAMQSWEHSGFGVHAAEPIAGDDEDARCFLARYLKKNPVAIERLDVDDSGREPVVTYCHGKGEDERTRSFTPLEFLAELTLHQPLVFEQTTRYYGVYSARTRGAKRRDKKFKELLESNFQAPVYDPPPRPASKSWARCIKRVFEVDPLLCQRCGSEMKIVAFIQDPKEIERIAQNIGLPTWRAPPKPKSIPRGIQIDTSAIYNQTLQ